MTLPQTVKQTIRSDLTALPGIDVIEPDADRYLRIASRTAVENQRLVAVPGALR